MPGRTITGLRLSSSGGGSSSVFCSWLSLLSSITSARYFQVTWQGGAFHMDA